MEDQDRLEQVLEEGEPLADIGARLRRAAGMAARIGEYARLRGRVGT